MTQSGFMGCSESDYFLAKHSNFLESFRLAEVAKQPLKKLLCPAKK